ncbi:MAG TPA: hypothetical protein VJT73_11415, partial [Polyangiaceae bacterium]|nr:hypothetical protein [Polyangiaceae bacterium]
IDGGRPGWDAAALARAWSSEPWALSRRLAFVPVPLDLFRTKDELYFEDVELALLHDEPSRADWLIDRLRENQRLEGANAIVMGPWLGVGSDVAVRLARAVGRPIGEALSAPGGPAGARFERARDALFARLGTPRHAGRVTALRADGLRGAEVVLASGEVVVADAVVVATGGLVGGGLAWSRAGFVLSFACSGALAQRHAVLDRGASGPGTPFAPLAWVVGSRAGFERVGLWIDELARLRGPDGRPLHALYAAGDAVADAPRTLGAAIGSGVRAGLAAAAG